MDLKDFSGLWVCFGLDADSATMNANGRSEPKKTDAALCSKGGFSGCGQKPAKTSEVLDGVCDTAKPLILR